MLLCLCYQVRFLNEDETIAIIGDAIQERLVGANCSRIYLTQVIFNFCFNEIVKDFDKSNPIYNSLVIYYHLIFRLYYQERNH